MKRYLYLLSLVCSISLFAQDYSGCTNPLALNFDAEANNDDGTCLLVNHTPENYWDFQASEFSHLIVIPESADLTINNAPLKIGDFIGVFYTYNEQEFCAGYSYWMGTNTHISVWGSNEESEMQLGTSFEFKVWDSETAIAYPADAAYTIGGPYIGGVFSINAFSQLSSLSATGTTDIALNAISSPVNGCGLLSTNVSVEILNLGSTDVYYIDLDVSYNSTSLSDGQYVSLLSNTTSTHTINESIDLTGLSTIDLLVSLDDDFDDNNSNNTVLSSITNQSPLSVQISGTQVSCIGESDASLQIEVDGGNGAYSIEWEDGLSGFDVSDLAAGNYTFTVSDEGLCSATIDAVITEPSVLSFDLVYNPILCADSTTAITFDITGGVAPYEVDWLGSNNLALYAGTHSAIITDANSCSLNAEFTLAEPQIISVENTISPVPCVGETASVQLSIAGGTGDYSVNWQGVDSLEMPNGSFTVLVSDENSCLIEHTILIEDPEEISISLDKIDALCSDGYGMIDPVVSGGSAPYILSFDGDMSALIPGNYLIGVEDANGCVKNEIFSIEEAESDLVGCYGISFPDDTLIFDPTNSFTTIELEIPIFSALPQTVFFSVDNSNLVIVEDSLVFTSAGSQSISVEVYQEQAIEFIAEINAISSEWGEASIVIEGSIVQPEILLSTTILDFQDNTLLNSDTLSFWINNIGTAVLEVNSMSSSSELVDVDWYNSPINPGDSLLVNAIYTPVNSGYLQSLINILTNDPINPGMEVICIGNAVSEVLDIQTGNWTTENSPYSVLADIIIPHGDTLEIESGVVVNFVPNTKLIVQGTLITNGTQTDSIYFNNAALVVDSSDTAVNLNHVVFNNAEKEIVVDYEPTLYFYDDFENGSSQNYDFDELWEYEETDYLYEPIVNEYGSNGYHYVTINSGADYGENYLKLYRGNTNYNNSSTNNKSSIVTNPVVLSENYHTIMVDFDYKMYSLDQEVSTWNVPSSSSSSYLNLYYRLNYGGWNKYRVIDQTTSSYVHQNSFIISEFEEGDILEVKLELFKYRNYSYSEFRLDNFRIRGYNSELSVIEDYEFEDQDPNEVWTSKQGTANLTSSYSQNIYNLELSSSSQDSYLESRVYTIPEAHKHIKFELDYRITNSENLCNTKFYWNKNGGDWLEIFASEQNTISSEYEHFIAELPNSVQEGDLVRFKVYNDIYNSAANSNNQTVYIDDFKITVYKEFYGMYLDQLSPQISVVNSTFNATNSRFEKANLGVLGQSVLNYENSIVNHALEDAIITGHDSTQINISNSIFSAHEGSAIHILKNNCEINIENSEFTENQLDVLLIDGENCVTNLSKAVFKENENWAYNATGHYNLLEGDSLLFENNGAGLRSQRSNSGINLFDVVFSNNTGNAIETNGQYSHVRLEKGVFSGNASAVYMVGDAFATLDNCVIHDNSGIGVRTNGNQIVNYSTIFNNGGIGLHTDNSMALQNSIVFNNNPNELMQVYCAENLDAQYSIIQGVYSYGINSNPNEETLNQVITADPNLDENGYLLTASPAIDAAMPWEHDHIMPPGLDGVTADMGAYGGPNNHVWGDGSSEATEIPDGAPSIVEIIDIPQDQGGFVGIQFEGSVFDFSLAGYDIQYYSLWRNLQLDPFGEDFWEKIGEVPAQSFQYYGFTAETLGDSILENPIQSEYSIIAHTNFEDVYWMSEVGVGYSIDNVAPLVPEGMEGRYMYQGDITLDWNPPLEDDFTHSQIYRDGVYIGETNSNEFIDETILENNIYSYSVHHVDLSGNLSDVGSIEISSMLPIWNFGTSQTSHHIAIPADITISMYQDQLDRGDFIGVFYELNNSYECGGMIQWSEEDIVLTAYGNSDNSNGFNINDEFIWRYWDASKNEYYHVDVTYDNALPNSANFIDDGLSALQSIHVYAKQEIDLPQGWSMISSYVLEDNLLMSSLLAPVNNDIFIVKDENGTVYWPAYSFNEIGDLSDEQGYKLLMHTANSIEFTGRKVIPNEKVLNLNEGWQIMPYLREKPASAEVLFETISESIVIVKDDLGNVYWPQWGVNTIGNLLPGKGYQVKMTNDRNYNYPANALELPLEPRLGDFEPEYFVVQNRTASNMTIGIPLDAWDVLPNILDEIAVCDAQDRVLGSAVFNGEDMVISVWANDEYSPSKVGMLEGESFQIKYRNQNNNTTYSLKATAWEQGSSQFEEDEIAIVSWIEQGGIIDKDFHIYPVVPNPSSSMATLQIFSPEDKIASIKLINILGELVFEENIQVEDGIQNYEIPSYRFGNGVYTVKVETDCGIDVQSIQIIR